jgi:predicted anti-sigma-YlaC factor YlaD
MSGEMDDQSSSLPRFCRETRGQLPALLADELSGWSERVVRRHLRRCADCSAELARQQQVSAGLSQLKGQAPEPPPELLAGLLEQARRPGWRGRVAVPARGAVSGARPELSVAFLTVGALATTGVGWAAWRTGRAATRRIRHR